MGKLEVKDITKDFDTGDQVLRALDGVSFTIEDEEFASIIGPSGSGKTTLLRILDGLIEPTGGELLINEEPVTGSDQSRGMVFQEFNLFPWRSVLGNVEFGLEARGDSKQERREVARTFIDMVGLDGFEDAYPAELSGGMKQRVGLARALTIDPEILLMDEPLSALDEQTRELMQTELLDIWQKHKKTCVFVTHDIEEALFLSDKVIVLSDRPGRVKDVIDVPFERPRSDDLKGDGEFSRLRHNAWSTLVGDQELEQTA